jgi:uncharacterized protein HemY
MGGESYKVQVMASLKKILLTVLYIVVCIVAALIITLKISYVGRAGDSYYFHLEKFFTFSISFVVTPYLLRWGIIRFSGSSRNKKPDDQGDGPAPGGQE